MKNQLCYIVVTNEFDDLFVSQCFVYLRQHHYAVQIISARKQIVTGQHGLKLYAHAAYTQLDQSATPAILLIPGSQYCATSLIADPRTIDLICHVGVNGGVIACTSAAYQLLKEIDSIQRTPRLTLLKLESAFTEDQGERLIGQCLSY